MPVPSTQKSRPVHLSKKNLFFVTDPVTTPSLPMKAGNFIPTAQKINLNKDMKLAKILITSALLGGVAVAQDEEKTFGDGGLPEFLQQYDANEDGVIDEEERQAIKEARKAAREERRAELDTDGDGEISREEREAAREAIRERIAAKRAEKFAEIAGDDGILSLEEFAALPPLKRVSEERVASIFTRLDADESDGVTLEEFIKRLRGHGPGGRPGDRPGNGGGGDDEEEEDEEEEDDEEEEGGPRPPRPGGR